MFCRHCGKEISEGQVFCQHCGGKTEDAAGAVAPAAGRRKTDWEERGTIGFFQGLFATIKRSLFTPAEFFRGMAVTGGLADPLTFGLITGMVGMICSYFWQIMLQNSLQSMLPEQMRTVMGGYGVFGGIGMAFAALLAPLVIIAGLFIWAGILHVLLLLLSGAKNGFEATFRVVAYSYGASLFMALPFCGGLIASLWSIVLAIIGLKEAHGTSGGKASFAVLFPLIVCCVAAGAFAVLVFGALAASMGSMAH